MTPSKRRLCICCQWPRTASSPPSLTPNGLVVIDNTSNRLVLGQVPAGAEVDQSSLAELTDRQLDRSVQASAIPAKLV